MRLDRFFDQERLEGRDHQSIRRRPARPGAGLGFARRRDIEDRSSQREAPRGGGRPYDRSGERQYEHELERFEQAPPALGGTRGSWELDEGGVQFGAVSHAGRGPRGYRRSDERIREDVCDLLTEAHDVDATEIEIAVADSVVTLSGTVDTRSARRRAEDIALQVPGVADVHNRLTARTAPRRAERSL
jgi:hypothetical protein